MDVSDVNNVKTLKAIPMADAYDVILQDNIGFVSTKTGINLLDITNITEPVLKSTIK